jgi:tetratricopeptide (TPR) repeat protein
VSASFGNEKWKAESYQQVMMAIKTRVGPVYMKILSRGGNTDVFTMKDERSDYDRERSGGNYGAGTAAEMEKRYTENKVAERSRKELFNDGVSNFKAGDYDQALNNFQKVKSMEPKNYIGDSFERVTEYYKVAAYNAACCYSKLEQEEAGLKALNEALGGGWEDYDRVRTDKNLEWLRQSPKFKPLLEQYDEPIFNTEVFDAFKNFKNPFR